MSLKPRSDAGDQILRLIADPFQGQMAIKSLVASLAVSLSITVLIGLLFSFVRPYNSNIYQPKIKAKLKFGTDTTAPPRLGKSPWAWIIVAFKTKEDDLVQHAGYDAALFIRFTKMWRNIFLVLTALGCAILVPVAVIGGKKQYSAWEVSTLLKVTPQFMFGRIFWAHVVVAYAFNTVVLIFLFFNYRAVVRLRRRYFDSPGYQRSLHSRTLMLRDIPSSDRTDESLNNYSLVLSNKARQDSTSGAPRAVIARNVKDLPKLIEKHENAVRQLETALAKYLKRPDRDLPATRPTYKPSKKERERLGSKPVDAIDHWSGQISHLRSEISAVRNSLNSRDSMSYGFISYPNIEMAHAVAYVYRNKRLHGATIKLAPRPRDLLWKNLSLTPRQKRFKLFMSSIAVVLLTVVWTVPNALIAVFLTNLYNLASVWHAFEVQLHKNPKTWAAVQGVLSPALTSLFYFFLPSIFRKLSIRAGDISKSSRERHVTHKLYSFFVFNNLIIFSLFSTIWRWGSDVIRAQEDGNVDLATALKSSGFTSRIMIGLCNMSPFWIFWLLQRNLGAAIDLSQVAQLAWVSLARRFGSHTPREIMELTAPSSFDYASYYNYFLFYATVAICFAPLQPLVLPVTALYFGVDCYLKKYLLLYVFVTKNESGGQFWRVLFNRVLFALFLGNAVIAIIVAANGFDDRMLYALIPLPLTLIAFKVYCVKHFDSKTHFYAIPSTSARSTDIESSEQSNRMSSHNYSVSRKTITSLFGHPALYQTLMRPMVEQEALARIPEVYNSKEHPEITGPITLEELNRESAVIPADPASRGMPKGETFFDQKEMQSLTPHPEDSTMGTSPAATLGPWMSPPSKSPNDNSKTYSYGPLYAGVSPQPPSQAISPLMPEPSNVGGEQEWFYASRASRHNQPSYLARPSSVAYSEASSGRASPAFYNAESPSAVGRVYGSHETGSAVNLLEGREDPPAHNANASQRRQY